MWSLAAAHTPRPAVGTFASGSTTVSLGLVIVMDQVNPATDNTQGAIELARRPSEVVPAEAKDAA